MSRAILTTLRNIYRGYKVAWKIGDSNIFHEEKLYESVATHAIILWLLKALTK